MDVIGRGGGEELGRGDIVEKRVVDSNRWGGMGGGKDLRRLWG